ncbi:MAG: protein-disulfide reductase DsbD [Pseudomonadota bacterium]
MNRPRSIFVSTLLWALAATGFAQSTDDILPPDQAFSYTATADDKSITLRWQVADGYYMYRHRFGFASNTSGVELADAQIPPGKRKVDEWFGEVETYRGEFDIIVPYSGENLPLTMDLEIKSQGCADVGLCFPPQTWTKTIDLPVGSVTSANVSPGVQLLTTVDEEPPLLVVTDEFLRPEEAFVMSASMADPYTLKVRWDIADGYYLYKEKIQFESSSDHVQLGNPRFPAGKFKEDEFFGRQEVFFKQVDVLVPVSRAGPEAGEFEFVANSQGCAEDGICYPPRDEFTAVALPDATNATPTLAAIESGADGFVSKQDQLANIISTGSLFSVIGVFFLGGLLLAFTPCVLPMVPILSGIISGQGENVTRGRAFALSLTYVLGMALTYTIGGTIAASFGAQLQTFFQQTWIIVLFSGLFVVLALSMFGMFELQMPAAIQTRLTNISNNQKSGTFVGVAVMGVLSALIVTACVAPPLIAALFVISETGETLRGALALFAMSMGMGTPLLIVGASAGQLLPKAGAWMNTVKAAVGVMLLGLAIWFLERILEPQITMLLWATLILGSAVALLLSSRKQTQASRLAPVVSVFLLLWGGIVLASGFTGGHSPWKPLAGSTLSGQHTVHLEFIKIKSVDDLQDILNRGETENKTVMLDLYADWCVSCKEMEKYTFTVPEVHSALETAIVVQADVTQNDDLDQALLKFIGTPGPPTISFYQASQELRPYRLVGFVPADDFVVHVERALKIQASNASL